MGNGHLPMRDVVRLSRTSRDGSGFTHYQSEVASSGRGRLCTPSQPSLGSSSLRSRTESLGILLRETTGLWVFNGIKRKPSTGGTQIGKMRKFHTKTVVQTVVLAAIGVTTAVVAYRKYKAIKDKKPKVSSCSTSNHILRRSH